MQVQGKSIVQGLEGHGSQNYHRRRLCSMLVMLTGGPKVLPDLGERDRPWVRSLPELWFSETNSKLLK